MAADSLAPEGDGRALDESGGAGLLEVARGLAERNAQLERALETRVVIEQAKGVLAERLGVSPDQAFEVLRRAARNHRLKIHGLAARVVNERQTPPELAEILRR